MNRRHNVCVLRAYIDLVLDNASPAIIPVGSVMVLTKIIVSVATL